MRLTCEDWRAARPDEIDPLLKREADVWRTELDWDVSHSWRVIEPARAARVLPGFVARSATGAIAGWTWFLQHRETLQVGALVAGHSAVSTALVDAIQRSAPAQDSSAQVWSVRGNPGGLMTALERYGLQTARYFYLAATLSPSCPVPESRARSWRPGDLELAAPMFSRAYNAGAGAVRAFASRGTTEDWIEYLGTLFHTDGCGIFQPATSFIVCDPGRTEATAAVITTEIADRVAHLAQIAVGPGEQGRGTGRATLDLAMAAAAAAGYRRMTLFVAEANAAARRLYAASGFERVSEFVVAASQPRRSTSVELVSGGASTRL